jgi:NADPH-dependent 7-cyano-7-deazaguanine reductase QueF
VAELVFDEVLSGMKESLGSMCPAAMAPDWQTDSRQQRASDRVVGYI